METFDIKRGFYSNVEGDGLHHLMMEVFGNCTKDGGWCNSNYGAMRPIRARIISKNELELQITTVKIPDEEVLDTMKKRNIFLERATGFNSKERLKRLKDRAKSGEF